MFMFNTKRPPSYFLVTLFARCCYTTFLILFLVVIVWGNIRKRPGTFALGRFIGLQSVVPSLLFTFSSLLFCTEIYSHTSLMLMLLMTFSPFTVSSLDGSAVI